MSTKAAPSASSSSVDLVINPLRGAGMPPLGDNEFRRVGFPFGSRGVVRAGTPAAALATAEYWARAFVENKAALENLMRLILALMEEAGDPVQDLALSPALLGILSERYPDGTEALSLTWAHWLQCSFLEAQLLLATGRAYQAAGLPPEQQPIQFREMGLDLRLYFEAPYVPGNRILVYEDGSLEVVDRNGAPVTTTAQGLIRAGEGLLDTLKPYINAVGGELVETTEGLTVYTGREPNAVPATQKASTASALRTEVAASAVVGVGWAAIRRAGVWVAAAGAAFAGLPAWGIIAIGVVVVAGVALIYMYFQEITPREFFDRVGEWFTDIASRNRCVRNGIEQGKSTTRAVASCLRSGAVNVAGGVLRAAGGFAFDLLGPVFFFGAAFVFASRLPGKPT